MTKYTLYHGTKQEFSEFQASATGAQGPGVYLADSEAAAAMYGTVVMTVEAEINKPFYFYPSDDSFDAEANPELLEQVLGKNDLKTVLDRMDKDGMAGYGYEVQNTLKAAGYDAIIMVCPWGSSPLPEATGESVVIVFDPAAVEIKNAAPKRRPSP